MTAAALAAGVISSQAQTVYSQNVVGYVNVSIPAGKLQMVANQLDTGSNTLDNVFQGTGLVSGSTVVLEWTGAGYNQYTYLNPTASNPITGAFGAMITQLNELSQLAGLPPLNTSLFASTIPPILVGGYGQSWSNIGAATFPTVQAGLQFSFPIRNRTADANAAVAAAEGKRLHALRDQAEMLIEADVRNSLQAASSAQARYAAAILARQSAEEQYASEQRQFQSGTSTVFLVLQRQTDLIVARTREVRAQADLAVAAANLDRATASTLDTLKIGLK